MVKNDSKVFLISQDKPSIFKKLFFNNDYCEYLELKTPTTEFKLKLVKKWIKKENIYLSDFVIRKMISKTDNLFKLKGLFNQFIFLMKFNKERV